MEKSLPDIGTQSVHNRRERYVSTSEEKKDIHSKSHKEMTAPRNSSDISDHKEKAKLLAAPAKIRKMVL